MTAANRAPRHSLKSLTVYAEGLEHAIAVTQISLARIGQQLEETRERLATLEKRNLRHAGQSLTIQFMRERLEYLELVVTSRRRRTTGSRSSNSAASGKRRPKR